MIAAIVGDLCRIASSLPSPRSWTARSRLGSRSPSTGCRTAPRPPREPWTRRRRLGASARRPDVARRASGAARDAEGRRGAACADVEPFELQAEGRRRAANRRRRAPARQQAAAGGRALHVHVDTVRNRLGRFEEITGASLKDVERLVEICMGAAAVGAARCRSQDGVGTIHEIGGAMSEHGTTTGFFHAGVTVRDMDESLRFYCDGLGLELVTDLMTGGESAQRIWNMPVGSVRAVFLSVPGSDAMVELFEFRGDRAPRRLVAPAGLRRRDFCVFVDDADAVHARIESLGFGSRSGADRRRQRRALQGGQGRVPHRSGRIPRRDLREAGRR